MKPPSSRVLAENIMNKVGRTISRHLPPGKTLAEYGSLESNVRGVVEHIATDNVEQIQSFQEKLASMLSNPTKQVNEIGAARFVRHGDEMHFKSTPTQYARGRDITEDGAYSHAAQGTVRKLQRLANKEAISLVGPKFNHNHKILNADLREVPGVLRTYEITLKDPVKFEEAFASMRIGRSAHR